MIGQAINRRNWIRQATILGAASTLTGTFIQAESAEQAPQAAMIKLSGNENPYGPSDNAREAMTGCFKISNRYPFGDARALQGKVAQRFDLSEQRVLLGAGSSHILEVLGRWVADQGLPLVHSAPTFDILPTFVGRHGGEVHTVPMTGTFDYDLEGLIKASANHTGVVYLVNPNNPTGTKIPRKELLAFCREVTRNAYLILDEAYIEYISDDESLVSVLGEFPRLIIVRTFSKIFGLAGMRIGYLLGGQEIVSQLKDLSIWSYHSMNALGIAAASASLADMPFVKQSRSRNQAVKKETLKGLAKLAIRPANAAANFVFFPIPGNKDLQALMLAKGIRIGQLSWQEKLHARVTIGTHEEMNQFVKSITEIYA